MKLAGIALTVILAMFVTAGAVTGVTIGVAHGGGVATDTLVQCTYHVDADGNGSINKCHTVHKRLAWQSRTCTYHHPVNCYQPGHYLDAHHYQHAAYVRFWDGNTCVFYIGSLRYGKKWDYCA